MKKLTRNQGIAVFASIGMLAYLFFSGPLMNLFKTPSAESQQINNQMPTTGFTTKEVTIGLGPIAERGDRLTMHYVGTLLNGQVFDSSRDRNTPITFILGIGQVIRGWDEGVIGMREGGKRILTIAPDYGYGAQSVGPIPANSTLVFEVELLQVEKPVR